MDSRQIEADLYSNVSAEIGNVFEGRTMVFKSSTKATITGDIKANATIHITDNAEVKVESKIIHPTTKFILENKAKLTFVINPPAPVVDQIKKTPDATVVYPKSQSFRLVNRLTDFVPGIVPTGSPRKSVKDLPTSTRKVPS